MSFHVPEQDRITSGPLATDFTAGNNGAFLIKSRIGSRLLLIIASDGADWQQANLPGEPWEHVSVHAQQGKQSYTPTWIEMAQVKDIFWDAEDTVMQLHPAQSTYINTHPNTLHLWRPTVTTIPTPPISTV